MPLSTQVYSWVGINPAIDQRPIQEGAEILLDASCSKNRDKLRPAISHFARMQTINSDFQYYISVLISLGGNNYLAHSLHDSFSSNDIKFI